MATALDEITTALTLLGVLASGETASADDANYGLAELNRMVDKWATESLMIYTITRTVFTITPSVQTYTVGTGGAVNVARPVFIDHVSYLDSTTNPVSEFRLDPLTDDEYAALIYKTLTNTLPATFYYNPTFPLGTLTLFPVPTNAGLQGVLYAPQAVTSFAALTTPILLPPGYDEMIVTNLAIRLAASYERPIDQLQDRATEARAVVKRANFRLSDLSFEAGSLLGSAPGRWSIYQGP